MDVSVIQSSMYNILKKVSALQRRFHILRMMSANWLLFLVLVWKSRDQKTMGFRTVFLLIGSLLIYFQLTFPLAEWYPFFYTFHMLDLSFLFFIIPPLILFGLSGVKASFLSSFMRRTSAYSLVMFTLLFTMIHLPAGIAVLQTLNLSPNTLYLIMFGLALDWWRPLCQKTLSVEKWKKYKMGSMMALIPACTFLFADALFTPVQSMVSMSNFEYCISPGMSMADLDSFILPPRWDQALAAFLMIGFHKGSMMTVSRFCRKESGHFFHK